MTRNSISIIREPMSGFNTTTLLTTSDFKTACILKFVSRSWDWGQVFNPPWELLLMMSISPPSETLRRKNSCRWQKISSFLDKRTPFVSIQQILSFPTKKSRWRLKLLPIGTIITIFLVPGKITKVCSEIPMKATTLATQIVHKNQYWTCLRDRHDSC